MTTRLPCLRGSDRCPWTDTACDNCRAEMASLCSQCGEQLAAMVKVGTSDGWCTSCLTEAAVGEVLERLEACLRLRNADGTHKVSAEVRNIIRAATMDAPYESATP